MANWIKGAIKRPGALKEKYPRAAKGGFTVEELTKMAKNAHNTRTKRQIALAKTLKSFH